MAPKHKQSEDKSPQNNFLSNDFSQCFQQMRYYDSQIFQVFKFYFTLLIAILGASLTIYQIGLKEGIRFELPAIALVTGGFAVGLFVLFWTTVHRAYFVKVARYVNEQREHFLSLNPGGYHNKTGMYKGGDCPKYFNLHGAQAILTYIIAIINSAQLYLLLYLTKNKPCLSIVACLIALTIQVLLVIWYLSSKEKRRIG